MRDQCEPTRATPTESPTARVVNDRATPIRLLFAVLTGCLTTAACSDAKHAWERLRGVREPVELPVLVTTALPFHYPTALYTLRIQGNVTLQLYIDSLGVVVSESTRVAEHGPYIAFDSAALQGAPRLVFRPARQGDHRIGYRVLFPIKFRVPGAPPLPDDTLPARKQSDHDTL